MQTAQITVLGGGPAGLAVGYHARRLGSPCTVYEANARVGGNAVTFEERLTDPKTPGAAPLVFRFDSGAHRLHDKHGDVTADLRGLLGENLFRIQVPSQICHDGRFIDFPLSPLDLLKKLGPIAIAEASASLLSDRMRAASEGTHFEAFAVRTYGRALAERFLLAYSEKLWGAPCRRLSTRIAGARLKGLDLGTFLKEAVLGHAAKTAHLDGAFWYPRGGIGRIVEALAAACGPGAVKTSKRITRVIHDGGRIEGVQADGGPVEPVSTVVSTLPLPLLLRLLDPAPPRELQQIASGLRFRNVKLVALFLRMQRVSDNGSVYFPDPQFPFTRVYEPRNRCATMAPPGYTSLVAEVPCHPGDSTWRSADVDLVARVSGALAGVGCFDPADVIGSRVLGLPHAYPILEVGVERRIAAIGDWLARLSNLRSVGRNGRFAYTHIHDMLRGGKETAELCARGALEPSVENRLLAGLDETPPRCDASIEYRAVAESGEWPIASPSVNRDEPSAALREVS